VLIINGKLGKMWGNDLIRVGGTSPVLGIRIACFSLSLFIVI